MFQNKMVTPAIPERVYTLCKIVEKKAMSSSEIKEKMEPAYLNQSTSYFGDYRTAAEELQLISNTDNVISLVVDPNVIKDMDSMRYYINGQLDRFRNGQFYKVTSAYFSLGDEVLHGEQNVANMDSTMTKATGIPVDMFFIPNACVFLQDIIKRSSLEKKYNYPIGEFLNKLKPYSDIIIDSTKEGKSFNYGVSNGLRTLQDVGFIKMEYIMDQKDSWNLYHIDALSSVEKVTNVTLLK